MREATADLKDQHPAEHSAAERCPCANKTQNEMGFPLFGLVALLSQPGTSSPARMKQSNMDFQSNPCSYMKTNVEPDTLETPFIPFVVLGN